MVVYLQSHFAAFPRQFVMFRYRCSLAALQGLTLIGCLAVLAGCGSAGGYVTTAASNNSPTVVPNSSSNSMSSNASTLAASSSSSASVPAVPAGVTATAGNAQVSLTWTASGDATRYHVKRATKSGGPYSQIAAPTSASYIDTSLTNGTRYYYVASALDSAGESANSAQVSAVPATPSPTKNACGMRLGNTPAIFCDTFDTPKKTASRAGDLDANVWGVSRASGEVNFGLGNYNLLAAATLQKCDGTTSRVNPPDDVIICNGQIREATNDNITGAFEAGSVTTLAMYPKQPFDFAGRTGTVSFDVSNDTAGPHAAWPEFWLSDLPVPIPFNHFDSWQSVPANGFGIRFAANAPINSPGSCPNLNNIDKLRWTVDSAAVVRNYVLDDTFTGTGHTKMGVKDLDCVIAANGPGQMNHVELRISQNQIDVYATDAGVAATTATLKHIAVVTNANLTLTRGLIWLEDVHYNADKGPTDRPSQKEHTFAWDNVAFDGPFVYRDFSYDALDNTAPGPNGSMNLGKFSLANQTSSWNVLNMPAKPQAAVARVLFSFNGELNPVPTVLNVIVNGHAHSVPWPYPDQLQYSWRTYAVTIPITDLVEGTNLVQLGADTAQVFSNVNIVLVNVPGGVPALPGSNNAYPGP